MGHDHGHAAGTATGGRRRRLAVVLGLTVAVATAEVVAAAGRGYVASIGWDPYGWGNYVVVQHRLGVRTLYAHLSSVSVRRGTRVSGGYRIGSVGSTSASTGPHLHFEVHVRGAAVDPLRAFL